MALTNRDQANEKLKEISLLQAALAVATGRFDRVIAKVKEKLFPKINELRDQITILRAELDVWAKEFRDVEFGGAKTLKLAFGYFQFRKCPARLDVRSGWTWEKSLETLLDKGDESEFAKYVRWTPTIDKELIQIALQRGELRLAHLTEIGLKVVEDESLIIKPDPQSALAA